MTLREYITLGSTYILLNPHTWLREGRGCFLGMAYFAKTGETTCEYEDIRRVFPEVSDEEVKQLSKDAFARKWNAVQQTAEAMR